ncbi:MAG: DUF1257 domain-containing protein [Euryarchaeota archaeon]|nr:DUF1257 domain-containing protein [Euryarchaeota archaeon]MDE1879453.1 DUF1257 domain-containing protein [Euryarchaeota archaeon]
MSHYASVETEFLNGSCLSACLREQFGGVEVHEQPTRLSGWYGTETDSAHFVVRKELSGLKADIGFFRGPDEKYRAIYDSMATHGDGWLHQLKQNYAERMVTRQALSSGYRIVGRTKTEDGKVRLIVETD